MTTVPHVSVIIPCRNEVRYIGACLDSLFANDYPKERLDVLVVDGMSDDGTRAVVESYTRSHPFTRLLENPQRVTPVALNLGIESARGSVIVLAGAHAVYPVNYISELVSWLQRSGADAVGGRCVACPGVDTAKARAIAAAVSHPFGVGNSYFRTGTAAPRWVDTVPFGCYWRDVFDRVGLFDEELVRDQDDELNLRILRHGGRLLLVPAIASQYYARESLGKLWRMFFQYGFFKPLVVRKVGGVMTLRQVIPALFVATVVATALLAPWLGIALLLFGLTLGGYLAADLVVATAIARRAGRRVGFAVSAVFPVLHFAYGLGYLLGVFEFLIRGKRPVPAVSLSR
jgi:cellulose synthase/poly-beta-1,6-N-acetylglucosamine synthase-like glycosyltransferase